MAAVKLRSQDEAERDLIRAWHAAVLTGLAWAGKLPSLTTLLDRSRAVRSTEMTLSAMGTQLTALLGQPRAASSATLAALRRHQESHG